MKNFGYGELNPGLPSVAQVRFPVSDFGSPFSRLRRPSTSCPSLTSLPAQVCPQPPCSPSSLPAQRLNARRTRRSGTLSSLQTPRPAPVATSIASAAWTTTPGPSSCHHARRGTFSSLKTPRPAPVATSLPAQRGQPRPAPSSCHHARRTSLPAQRNTYHARRPPRTATLVGSSLPW